MMSKPEKYYQIESYEWLLPTGDASKLLVQYSTADDIQGNQNRKDSSIVVRLSRDADKKAQYIDEDAKAKEIIAFLEVRIKNAIRIGNDLPSEITIMSYDSDYPTNLDNIEVNLGEWHNVIITRKMGFLPS